MDSNSLWMSWKLFWGTMDWDLFWTAFGAIGTTLGSLITAIAVVVAVRQYRQPLIKKVKIRFNSAFPVGLGIETDLFCIGVSNTGVRAVNISNIYLNVGEKDLVIHYAQFNIPGALNPLTFPIEIQPEQEIEMYLERLKIAQYFAENLKNGHFARTAPIKIAVTDKTGGRYVHSTGFTVEKLARLSTIPNL